MAAVTELCFLLFALINNIHARELISVNKIWESYTFDLPKKADSCLISRFVGEEKLVLWNTSDLQADSSTVPADLKERLSVVSTENISSYNIHKLTESDSGLYREECWTEGEVSHEKNISIIVCNSMADNKNIPVRLGQTVDLPCYRAADDLDVLWLRLDFGYDQEIWTRVFGDNMTSVVDNVRAQVVKKTTLRLSNLSTTAYPVFACVVMNQKQCVSAQSVQLDLDVEVIYRSVGETAVLPCTVFDFSGDQPPRWISLISNTELRQENHTVPSVAQNYSLMFSSLTLNHSGLYDCQTSMGIQRYHLVVCPEFVLPAAEVFSEGEDVTLTCTDLEKGTWHLWFIRSNRTEGRVVCLKYNLSVSRVSWHLTGSLVISDVSQKDTGEFWCAVLGPDDQCVSTTKTLVKYREPFGVHSTFYKVRCSVLSALLLTLCAAVVTVNWRTRRREQL